MGELAEGVEGPRWVLERSDERFPEALRRIADPPERLYGVGDASALQQGLAVVGARKATPYGRDCAHRFALRAAKRGVVIISGGARGCDAEAHRAAIEAGAPTVVFLGGGCDMIYPKENRALFQEVVRTGGALVSEHDWSVPPLPYMFRARNRLIAGLARATLIVEAGLPSGTFTTADDALEASREVLVVPGSIDSKQSRGANRLIYQGATPVVDDETFDDQLFYIFGLLKMEDARPRPELALTDLDETLLDALTASPLTLEEVHGLAMQTSEDPWSASSTNAWIARMTAQGLVTRFPGGSYGAIGVRSLCRI